MTGSDPSAASEYANSLEAGLPSEPAMPASSDPGDDSLEDYYTWQQPDRGLTICLKPEAMDSLQSEILATVDRFGRGRETCGILLGTRQAHGARRAVFVTGYRAVASIECQQSRPAPHRTADFEAALRTINSSGRFGPLSVVGFYRSHNRNGLYLSDDDVKLIQEYFSDPDIILMAIKTLAIGACTAGFFFRDERGRVQSEFPQVELPLTAIEPVKRAQARFPQAAIAGAPVRAGMQGTSELEQTATVDLAGKTARAEGARVRWLLNYAGAALFAGLAGISLGVGVRNQTRKAVPIAPAPVNAPIRGMLNLNVQQTAAGHIELTWDRERPEILAAKGGVLAIRDGSGRQRIELKTEHIQSGAVAYSPATADVEFRLELERNGLPPLFDSIHVFMPEQASEPATKRHAR